MSIQVFCEGWIGVPEERREQILDAAESMALQEGYRHFNLDKLARRLRMSKNTIYTCFSSKEELFFAALNRRASRIVQRLKEITAMEVSAEEKLYLASECIISESGEMDSHLMCLSQSCLHLHLD